MLSPDRGIRNLLPILEDDPDEVVLPADRDGTHVRPTAGADLSNSQVLHHDIDPAIPEVGLKPQPTGAARQSDIPSTYNSTEAGHSTHASKPFGSGEDLGEIDVHWRGDLGFSGSNFTHATPSMSGMAASRPVGGSSGTSEDGHEASLPHEQPKGEASDSNGPEGGSALGGVLPPGAGVSAPAPGQMPIPLAVPDGDDLHVVQTAFVDQDADVLLNGWVGDSKIRVFMENDADIDQDVDIDLDYDSNGRMFLRLNQFMTIDQETEIDLDIYEVKGVLYVDLHLRNEVDIEQDTELDLMMGGWNGSSLVHANNDLDVRQHTDVDVDIDDDLEEQFKIKVAVGIKQAIHADQDADIDLTYSNGAFGVDLDAIQTATIEQDTTLKIDFSVI